MAKKGESAIGSKKFIRHGCSWRIHTVFLTDSNRGIQNSNPDRNNRELVL